MGNKYVGWRVRMIVIKRDRGCRYCGKPIAYCTEGFARGNACWRAYDCEGQPFHFDHRIPFSKGGSSGPENILLACRKCNLSKGTSI